MSTRSIGYGQNEMKLSKNVDRFGVIVADPPWNYNVKAYNYTPDRHYDIMSDAAIAALPVGDLAADDSVLLCWVTWPKLDVGVDVIKSWGFEYVTGFPWIKVTEIQPTLFSDAVEFGVQWGVGYWARGCSESLLIARRGKPTIPDHEFVGLLSPNARHSKKPADVYEYAEALTGPRVELFARRPRPGWVVWGNDPSLTGESFLEDWPE